MIYIDTPSEYSGIKAVLNGRRFKSSHMMSDQIGQDAIDELLAFGQSIGLKPEWIQDSKHPIYVHFDVMNRYYSKALSAGAIPISPKDMARLSIQKKQKFLQNR